MSQIKTGFSKVVVYTYTYTINIQVIGALSTETYKNTQLKKSINMFFKTVLVIITTKL